MTRPLRVWLTASLVALAPHAAAAQVLSGTYTGDGTNARFIDQLGFQPDVVIVKGNNTQVGVIRSSSMAGDNTKPMTGATALTANLIEALNTTGFTIGDDSRVNQSTIDYHWIAFKQGSKRLKVGSYTGNGAASQAVSGVGFSPEFVVIMAATGSEAVWRSSADTESFNFTTGAGASWITTLGADGFTVANDARVNTSGTTYHYVAWNEVDGVMDVGAYTGNGTDGTNVTTTTFQPEYVLVKRDGGSAATHHPASVGLTTDSSLFFTAAAAGTNRIEQLTTTGFQIGTNAEVNQGGQTYNYVAWRRVVPQTEVLTGTYTGDGTDDRAITGLGFSPDLVIVKGDTTQNAVLRAYPWAGDFTKDLIDGTVSANRIQSLDVEGFTIGSDARVNSSGETYHWIAWVGGAGEMTSGTYTGNGTSGRNITELGFSPDFVIVVSASAEAVYRNSAASASHSFDATSSAAWISAMGTDGFTVGNDTRVNANGATYAYVAWNEVAGKMDVGTYAGDANDDRDVTGIGFQPEYALVQRNATGYNALHHPASLGTSTDATLFFDNRGAFQNYIQALQSDGFQVGQQANVNVSGATFVYAVWKRATLTAVGMTASKASRSETGVTITWRTGYEVDNLGFDVYREKSGERTRVTSGPIGGSALLVPQGVPMTAGRSYTWTDESPLALEKDVTYWIEDIDLNGKRTLHGPITPAAVKSASSTSPQPRDAAPPGPQETTAESSLAEAPVQNSPMLEDLRLTEPQTAASAEPATAPSTGPVVGPIYGALLPVVTSAAEPTSGAAPTAAVQPASGSTVAGVEPVQTTATTVPASSSVSVQPQPLAPVQPLTEAVSSSTGNPATPNLSATTPTSAPIVVVSQPLVPVAPARFRFRARPLITTIAGAPRPPDGADVVRQWAVASQAAARVMVRSAGWYRLTQPSLIAAGIDPAVDPRNLRLVLDGQERPMLVTGEQDGTFDAGDSVEFYATGVDTPYTDRRAYWIAGGSSPGLRLSQADATVAGTSAPAALRHTVERKVRQVFFGALQNGDRENYFGPLIMDGEITTQQLTLTHVAATGSQAQLEIGLQGVTALPGSGDHRVGVRVNGVEVGEMVFDGRAAAVAVLPVPHALLTSGPNTIAFETRGGADDMSLVDFMRLTYDRDYRADADQLTLAVDAGQQVTIAGFTSAAIRIFDVTGGVASRELVGTVAPDGGGWSTTFTLPGGEARKLFVATTSAIATPAALQANLPSTLHNGGQSGEILMITDPAFASSLTPLRNLRESQGYTVQIVDVQDIYDEFTFGEKSPAAIRAFLIRASESWTRPPRFVLLVGNATLDPRDYQGLGEPDFVPTRIVPTGVLETASDDWFADADNDGFAELAAVGRLPARTVADVSTMVDKIVAYEQSSPEAWHRSVLLVSDQGDSDPNEFSSLNNAIGGIVPSDYQVSHLKRAEDPTPAQTLRSRIADGAVVLNYQGHGSVDTWRGDLLTGMDAATLDNGARLPFVVAMTCFGGFFQGLTPEESLAEALLRASGGGAIGVWASSGMTDARWQSSMDRELFRQMFRANWTSIGEAIRAAKKGVGNADVRRTWIYFGDPALRLKGLSRAPVTTTPPVTPVAAPPQPVDDGAPPAEDGQNRRAPQTAVRLADFDADGTGDAFISEPGTGAWFAALGQPGSFRHMPGQFSVAGEPIALKLNDDARADLFVYNVQTGQWLQATSMGDGRFVSSTGQWSPGYEIVAGDFDGNGRDDLFGHHPDGSWFQAFPDGDGDYQYRHGLGLAAGNAYAADFNADGRADVFVYSASTGQWTLALTGADGSPVMTRGTWAAGWQPVVARLDGDAAADLVLWHEESGAWVQSFSHPTQVFVHRTGTWTSGGRVHAFDLNGDGRDELLRYDWRTGDWTLATLATGVMQQSDGLWELGWELTPGDLNGDGRHDLLLYNPDTGEWIRRLNLPSGWEDDASGLWSRNWTVAGSKK
jgi:hypothetical protein